MLHSVTPNDGQLRHLDSRGFTGGAGNVCVSLGWSLSSSLH